MKNSIYDDLLHQGSYEIDKDHDFHFPLRGNANNLFIDTATPLFGLSLRVRNLSNAPQVKEIYDQVVNEIKVIEIELTENGYEHAVIMAYRYILCAFLDEAVMATNWGSDSIWAQHSLLSRFHDETWGGEKVFVILSKLEKEPLKYKELLEFIYYCLNLGFSGKYKVIENGFIEREKHIFRLRDLLVSMNVLELHDSFEQDDCVVNKKYKLSRTVPVWSVFLSCFAFLLAVFSGYFYILSHKSNDVLAQLEKLL